MKEVKNTKDVKTVQKKTHLKSNTEIICEWKNALK